MKQIKMLVEDIQMELEGAEHCAKIATQYKDTDRTLADTYAKMAEGKLSNVNSYHEQAVRMIKEQQAKGAQVPEGMQAVWDWEHEKQMDKTARVKSLIAVYRGN